MHSLSVVLLPAFLASLALARTDLTGCTSTDVSSPAGASLAWYVPGTGEICSILDCGGGRAPPSTTQPGCPAYSGSATYSPSYLAGYTAAAAGASGSSSPAMSTSAPASMSTSWSNSASYSSWASSTMASMMTSMMTSSMTMPTTYAAVSPVSNATMTTTSQMAGMGPGMTGSMGSVGTTSRVASNGTASTASASPILIAGAAENARVWMGSAGMVVGLGAVVAAL